ncbi:unnamed protein product, partial [Heterosigma akashiwo]
PPHLFTVQSGNNHSTHTQSGCISSSIVAMQSAGITGRSGGALGQSSHYTDGDRSVATGSM